MYNGFIGQRVLVLLPVEVIEKVLGGVALRKHEPAALFTRKDIEVLPAGATRHRHRNVGIGIMFEKPFIRLTVRKSPVVKFEIVLDVFRRNGKIHVFERMEARHPYPDGKDS